MYSVDRIENDKAICENKDGEKIVLDLSLLPNNVREGDMIEEKDGLYFINTNETLERKKKISDLQKSVFGKKK